MVGLYTSDTIKSTFRLTFIRLGLLFTMSPCLCKKTNEAHLNNAYFATEITENTERSYYNYYTGRYIADIDSVNLQIFLIRFLAT